MRLLLVLMLVATASGVLAQTVPSGLRFEPGIYRSVEELKKGQPGIRVLRIDEPEQKATLRTIRYIGTDGKKASVPSMEIWGYSDGIGLYVRRVLPDDPKEFAGFYRTMDYQTLMLCVRPVGLMAARPVNQVRPATPISAPQNPSQGMSRSRNGPDGISSGTGTLTDISMRTPPAQRRPSNAVYGNVAYPTAEPEGLYFFIDLMTGMVNRLDGVYFPAFLRTHDEALHQAYMQDERPTGDRAKMLEFLQRFNDKHLPPDR